MQVRRPSSEVLNGVAAKQRCASKTINSNLEGKIVAKKSGLTTGNNRVFGRNFVFRNSPSNRNRQHYQESVFFVT
jgi:hypothetical protein